MSDGFSLKDSAALVSAGMWLMNNWMILAGAFVLFLAVQVLITLKRKTSKPFLDPENFKPLVLAEKRYITHNTCRLRFDLPDPDQRLGLPVGQHISFMAKDAEGKDVYRSYTPTSDDDTLGSVEFVIKIYPQGKMSQVLAKLAVGEAMMMKGPKGRFTYKPNMMRHIGMVAGGTGITPMYQVINAILKDPKDTTTISVIFGNLSEKDILLRNELDELVGMYGSRLSVYHVLNEAPDGWTQGTGFITPDIIKRHFPQPAPGVLTLRCGPLPMMNAMKEALDAIGYTEDMQFQF